MGWVRLDDRFPDHPKVEAISDRAFRLHIRGLCYCSKYLTDGRVPRAVAKRLGSLKSLGELMAAALWSDEKDGYSIHDYLEYNPSKAEADARSIARRNAANTRWSNASSIQLALGEDKDRSKREQEWFSRFWTAYPKRAQEGACRSLFRTILDDEGADAEAIIAGAEAYARSVKGKELGWIAAPLNWLRDGRWTDEHEGHEHDEERKRKLAEAKHIAEEGRA